MNVVFPKPRTVRIERKKRKARLRWIVSRLSQDPNTGIFGLSPIGFWTNPTKTASSFTVSAYQQDILHTSFRRSLIQFILQLSSIPFTFTASHSFSSFLGRWCQHRLMETSFLGFVASRRCAWDFQFVFDIRNSVEAARHSICATHREKQVSYPHKSHIFDICMKKHNFWGVKIEILLETCAVENSDSSRSPRKEHESCSKMVPHS
jgi:hypothetical protein